VAFEDLTRLVSVLRGRFARNWSLLVVSSMAGQALGMLATIRIARTLAPAGYGQYNLVQTVAGIGTVVALLGFRNVLVRETARHPERSADLFFVSAFIRTGMLLLSVLGIVVYSGLNQTQRRSISVDISYGWLRRGPRQESG
jgi:O-antigen/teichoic acid export membrane protein